MNNLKTVNLTMLMKLTKVFERQKQPKLNEEERDYLNSPISTCIKFIVANISKKKTPG